MTSDAREREAERPHSERFMKALRDEKKATRKRSTDVEKPVVNVQYEPKKGNI